MPSTHPALPLVKEAFPGTALDLAARGAMGEDVADLAHGDDLAAGLRQMIEERPLRRRDGEIAAVARALEAAPLVPDKRAGDHAADAQRVAERAGDAAGLGGVYRSMRE